MKNLLFACAILYTLCSFSQKSNYSKSSKKNAVDEAHSFVPPTKLLNTEIWTRVSNARFECNFLRLAVEYQNFEFILFEMDGAKRELSRAPEYRILGEEIAMNTFRVSPNYPGSPRTSGSVASSYWCFCFSAKRSSVYYWMLTASSMSTV